MTLQRKLRCRFLRVLILSAVLYQPVQAAEIWVSPNGEDNNAGTQASPMASPALALRKAREWRRLNPAATNEAVKIILRGGIFRLTSPLLFRPEDSGTETSPTIIEAAPGGKPVLSGGVEVTGWRKVPEKIPGLPRIVRGNVWVAESPVVNAHVLEFRQLWVNDVKAVRARQPNGDAMDRLVGWNRKREEAWIPSAFAQSLRWTPQLEMVIHQQWEIAVCRVKSFHVEDGKARVTFQEPESKIEFEHPWPQPVMTTNGNAPFFLVNAIEFLDQPGEWFQELPGGKIYYWPRAGEDLSKATVIAPALETLVQVEGSLDSPVERIQFKGIQFAHTT